jgi:ribonuclease III
MRADLEVLEAALGHTFRNRELLVRALTHKSRSHESARPGEEVISNEQLEFFGDAVLGFVVSEILFRRFPLDAEGRLSKRKAHLVSEARLYEVAQSLSLGDHLILGRGEEMSGGRKKKALLADAVEALIAALYLDGGAEAPRSFIEEQVVANAGVEDVTSDLTLADFKGALQQRAQALNLPTPTYVTVAESGSEHAKVFTIEARVGEDLAERAEGLTKKSAGQRAAQAVLQQMDLLDS